MSGATFSRLKNWNPEVLTNTDLNAEINNILNNLDPSGVGGWQGTITQMRLTTAPSEASLAASLSAEIQELRYMLLQLAGSNSTYWYSTPTTDLTQIKNAIGGAIANNRIISGTASSSSSRSRFLLASGTTTSVTLKAGGTPFSYAINGTIYSVSADVTLSGLSQAPATNNTFVVADTSLSGQERSKWTGEDGTNLNVTSMGSNIQSLVGSIAAFKTPQSEYFLGYVNSATQITNCFRGFFFDSTGTGVSRAALNNSDVCTMMKTAWVYANATGAIVVGYTTPKFQNATPSGAATGDYWYDMTAQTWKTFDSLNWNTASTTLVGLAIQNTAACVATRSFDYYSNTDALNTLALGYNTTSSITAALEDAAVVVGSNTLRFQYTKPQWDFTQNLETGVATASTTYWAYVGEQGQLKLSVQKPHDMNGSLKGYYHPFEMWRCVGSAALNSSTAFDTNTVSPLVFHPEQRILLDSSREMLNAAVAASISGSTMIVSLTRKNGMSADPINYIPVSFSTPTVGTYANRLIISALSITVPVGASLGHVGAINQYAWVYLIDNGGTVDIAVAGDYIAQTGTNYTAAQINSSSTAIGTMYSNAAYAGKPVRLIGRLLSNQTNAGTWTVTPTEVIVDPQPKMTITEPVTYTPTFGGWGAGGNNSVNFASWRVGKFLHITGTALCGTSDNSTALMSIGYAGVNSPSTVLIDTAYLTTAPRTFSGMMSLSGGPGSNMFIVYRNPSTQQVGISGVIGSGNPILATTSNAFNVNNTPFAVFCQIPIAGWTNWSPP